MPSGPDASAVTRPLVEAFQLATAPVLTDTFARKGRVRPPTCPKSPPTYTDDPAMAIAFTRPSAPGFQFGSTAPEDWMWASRARAKPPTVEKSRPMNQPPLPSGVTARTEPSTSGKLLAGSSLVVVSFTPCPVRGPIVVNVPPR